MSLLLQKCVPCNENSPKLSHSEAQALLKQTPGWELSTDGSAISRYVEFKNFREALAFTNKVGEVAEAEKHHPDIGLGWGYVDLTLMTHAIDGLHQNDFVVAAKINSLLGK